MVGNNAPEILQPPPTKTWASLFEAKTGIKTPINRTSTSTNLSQPTAAQERTLPTYSDEANSHRLGEFLSNYRLENRPVSLLPRGLTNRSNYCYVNAILQALIACSPFNNMLKALPSSQARSGNSSTPAIDSLKVLCSEYSMVASSSRSGHRRTAVIGPPLDGFASVRVLRALRQFSGAQGNRQEDAEEFLSCILNTLNDEMLEVIKANEPEEPKRDAIEKSNSVVAQHQSVCTVRRTPVADIFRGLTRTRLHRAPNRNVTDNVQPFFTLQLDIERSNTVQDALELLAAKDAIEGVPGAWQQLSFARLPLVLLLHLKCFQVDGNGHAKKIIKNFDFPVDLNIHPKMMSSKHTYKQRTYKLFAVVYHEGAQAGKGHYITDTFHSGAGWIRFDDAIVTQVTLAKVLKATAPRMPYILMYRRHDTLLPHRPPG